jgi:hypothetical protein
MVLSLRCPYQATVMNELDIKRRITVLNPFKAISLSHQ